MYREKTKAQMIVLESENCNLYTKRPMLVKNDATGREKRGLREKETSLECLDPRRSLHMRYIGFLLSFIKESFKPGLPPAPPRGGVTGRLLPSEGVFVFFSDGFKIYNGKQT